MEKENQTTQAEGVGNDVLLASTLWGVYFEGMDEWYAVESEAVAKEQATEFNAWMEKAVEEIRKRENVPGFLAHAKLWPYSKESHDSDLARQASEALANSVV